jgi:flagellar hook-associated protein 2
MAVQLTGLGGFDSGTVISQLVELAKKPVTDLDSKKSLVDSAGLTLNSFSTKLAALKTASTALSTTAGFTSMGVTSSDNGIVASVSGSPPPGSYTVSVTQLARAQKSRSDAQASATTALNQAGTLTFQIGTQTAVNVNVAATDTLSDIATKINQAGIRVSANVINAGGSYRLAIQGLDSGADNAFTITEGSGVSLGFANVATSRIETAQDANLTIDGLAVTRPTNQITGALPGMTLALTKLTTSPATLTVAGDSTQLKTKINALVTAYNDVVNAGHQATGYGTSKASNSVLAADPAIRRSLDRVSKLVAGQVTGASNNYRSLASIGLSLSREGTMSFDATKFDAALAKDPSALQKLFVTDTTLGATGVMKNIEDTVTSLITTDNGTIKARIAALQAQSRNIATSRTAKQARVDAYEKQLRKQFSDLDIAMSRYQSMSSALNSIE